MKRFMVIRMTTGYKFGCFYAKSLRSAKIMKSRIFPLAYGDFVTVIELD